MLKKPYELIRFGYDDAQNHYEFIGLGADDAQNPYESIRCLKSTFHSIQYLSAGWAGELSAMRRHVGCDGSTWRQTPPAKGPDPLCAGARHC